MALESGLCKVVRDNLINEMLCLGKQQAFIQCACMALFAISYLTLTEVNR